MCQTLRDRIPEQFNVLAAQKKFNSKPGGATISPTEIVLLQELERFNVLLQTMKENVDDLLKALKGEIGMSQDLDQMSTQLFIGQLPQRWRRYCPATLKPLAGWIQHLQQRND